MAKFISNKWFWIGMAALAVIIALAGTRYLKLKADKDKQLLAVIEQGDGFFLKGELDQAYELYQKAWDLKPEITRPQEKNAALNLAQLKMAKADMDGAKAILLKVNKLDPFFYPAYLFIGDIYLQAKDADKALFYLEKGLSLKSHFLKDDPNAALLYYNMAEALMLKGDETGAKKHFQEFLLLAEKDKRLGGIAAKAGNKLKALK